MAFDEAYYNDVHDYDEKWYIDQAYWVSNLTYGLSGKVLDIGCGRGYFTKAFLDMKKDIYGIDISDYAVSHPMPGCEGRIMKGDILDIPFKDDFFQWTFVWALMEHIPSDKIAQALREVARVAPLSLMCIAIIYSDVPGQREFYQNEDSTHITIENMAWWKQRFDEAGLEVVWYDYKMTLVLRKK